MARPRIPSLEITTGTRLVSMRTGRAAVVEKLTKDHAVLRYDGDVRPYTVSREKLRPTFNGFDIATE